MTSMKRGEVALDVPWTVRDRGSVRGRRVKVESSGVVLYAGVFNPTLITLVPRN